MSGDASRPPRVLEWLVSTMIPRASSDVVLGDLHECFLERVRDRGRAAATVWYARQALAFVALIPAARAAAAIAPVLRDFISPSGWFGDIRDACRAFVRERGLTIAVVAVLGLAVGGATTVFSVVTAVLLRPLPYERPGELVMIWDEYTSGSGDQDPRPVSLLHYRSWRDRSDLFTSIGAFESMPAVIDAGRWAERVDAALVSASLFRTLGVAPALGRTFSPDDDQAGAAPVAILSHELWQTVFGGDHALTGRSIEIDGVPTQVIGVMPPDFWFYDPYAAIRSYRGSGASTARLWRPLAGSFADETDYARYRVIGRLQPDVTTGAVAAALAAAEPELPLERASADGRVRVVGLHEQVEAGVRPRLLGLTGGVLLVLLIAAVNLVTLLTARFDARRPELAIRAALGAGRGRLARALMIHGVLLSIAGAAAGCLVALVAIPVLLTLVPRGLPLAHRAGLDAAMMLFALGASVAIGLAVTGFAAGRLGRGGEAAALASRSRAVAGRYAHGRVTAVTTTGEVALSLVLLVSATLLLRSLVGIQRMDAGFDRRDTVTFQSLLMLSGPNAAPEFAFFDRLETRLKALPGIDSIGSATILPFSRWGGTASVQRAGSESPAPRRIDYRPVSAGYFETLRIARLAGRPFGAADRPGSEPVAIVNRAFAHEVFGGPESALGGLLRVVRGREVHRRVVGVVDNTKEHQLFADDRPIVYVPIAQNPSPMRQFVVRSTSPSATLIESIRQTAAEIDRRQPLGNFITLEALVGQSIEEERFYALVATAFAGVAVLLSLSGLYGVVSFSVRRRVREVGVRIALGATPRDVYRLVMSEGMRPVLAGIVPGLIGAAASARLFRALIHGVPEADPVSYGAATAAFAVTAAAACFIPASRAANVDPVQALTED